MTTKISLFIVNYVRELRMETDIRRKRKVEKAIEFVERMKKIQKKVEVALKRAQKEIKRQVNKEKKLKKNRNKTMLSTKDLLRKRLAKKLIERYISLYIIEKVISTNTITLRLPTLVRIHLVINISQIIRYREPVKR